MKAICERHGFGYEVSEGCGYCVGLREEAAAKAAARPADKLPRPEPLRVPVASDAWAKAGSVTKQSDGTWSVQSGWHALDETHVKRAAKEMDAALKRMDAALWKDALTRPADDAGLKAWLPESGSASYGWFGAHVIEDKGCPPDMAYVISGKTYLPIKTSAADLAKLAVCCPGTNKPLLFGNPKPGGPISSEVFAGITWQLYADGGRRAVLGDMVLNAWFQKDAREWRWDVRSTGKRGEMLWRGFSYDTLSDALTSCAAKWRELSATPRPRKVDACQPQLRKLIDACKAKLGKVPTAIYAPGGFEELAMEWVAVTVPTARSLVSGSASARIVDAAYNKWHTIELRSECRWGVVVGDGDWHSAAGLGLAPGWDEG